MWSSWLFSLDYELIGVSFSSYSKEKFQYNVVPLNLQRKLKSSFYTPPRHSRAKCIKLYCFPSVHPSQMERFGRGNFGNVSNHINILYDSIFRDIALLKWGLSPPLFLEIDKFETFYLRYDFHENCHTTSSNARETPALGGISLGIYGRRLRWR